MSRGSVSVKGGRTALKCGTGRSRELATTTAVGSAACAQHPQVTQLGGQLPSSSGDNVNVRHGSPTIKLVTPVALTDSRPTRRASARRRTKRFYRTEELGTSRS